MNEILLLMVLLFAAYLFIPSAWLAKIGIKPASALADIKPTKTALVVPEDCVLRRHFLTQLRSEIEAGLSPRPTDSTLQRHYDAMIEAELENRLAILVA